MSLITEDTTIVISVGWVIYSFTKKEYRKFYEEKYDVPMEEAIEWCSLLSALTEFLEWANIEPL